MHSKITKCFTSQAARLKNHLKAIYTDEMLPEFRYGFILELPCSVRDEHEKLFHSKSSEISRAMTFDELFIHLDTYWDYLNYTLLEGVVDIHGTEEMQKDMESYVKDLEDFRRKTKLSVFLQLERHKIRRKPPPGFSQFVTKHCITRESTLQDIENLRLEATDEFQLRKFALLVIDIVEGSVIITWLVPSSVIGLLKEGLGKPEVLAKLHIDSVEFSNEFEQSDAPVDSDAELARLLQEKLNQEDLDSGSSDRFGHEESLEGTFFMAARSGDTTSVVSLVGELGVDVNTRNEFGRTALMLAAKHGHTDTVQALAALGADLHVQDTTCGQTALMWAAEDGHTDTVQALAALGADIHAQDQYGRTSLVWAAVRGKTDTVKTLEALGADIHVQDHDGNTALMLVLSRDCELCFDTAEALIAAGTKLNLPEKATGWTALFFAAKHGSLPLVKLMLESGGADPTIRDKEDSTAYDVASVYGHKDVMEELAKYTAPPHAETSPPPPECTTSSSTAQPTETAQSSSTSQTSKRERVFRAARILAERIEKMALPGRARKKVTGGPLPGPEEGPIIDRSKRQKSNKPGGR